VAGVSYSALLRIGRQRALRREDVIVTALRNARPQTDYSAGFASFAGRSFSTSSRRLSTVKLVFDGAMTL
jgi:hypothetical protein